MAMFMMHVKMDNSAFEDNGELPRILRETADKIDRLREFPFTLLDINGNVVGQADIEE
jgi:hypothetical protein